MADAKLMTKSQLAAHFADKFGLSKKTAGEVLDILAKDAPLAWGWAPEIDEGVIPGSPRSIWLVNLP